MWRRFGLKHLLTAPKITVPDQGENWRRHAVLKIQGDGRHQFHCPIRHSSRDNQAREKHGSYTLNKQ